MNLAAKPPKLYFRIREPGAAVFRVQAETPGRRLELDQIAIASVRTAEIKPHGDGPTKEERQEIERWIEQRRKAQKERDNFDMQLAIEQLNSTAQWLQSRAGRVAITQHAEDLLFALHDVRNVLVRRMADIKEKREADE